MSNVNRAPQDLVSVTAPPVTRFALLGGLLILLLVCIGLTLLNPNRTFLFSPSRPTLPTQEPLPSWLIVSPAGQSSTLYLQLPGAGDLPDLYSFNPASDTAPVNLSSSAGVTETVPVLSRDGSALAYWGIYRDGTADLFVLPLPNGRGTAITSFTGSTRLHNGFEIEVRQPAVWSPDGAWLAFVAYQTDGKGNAVDLYLARTKSPELIVLTTGGGRVSNPVWLSNDEIAYAELRGDGKLVAYRQKINQPGLPTPIATLQPIR